MTDVINVIETIVGVPANSYESIILFTGAMVFFWILTIGILDLLGGLLGLSR